MESILDENPWSASSIFDFTYFCCPECDDKSKSKQDFVIHAFLNHEGADDSLRQISDGSVDEIDFLSFEIKFHLFQKNLTSIFYTTGLKIP